MKSININKDYKRLRRYCEYHFDEFEEFKNNYYLFDKTKYKFVHCTTVNSNDLSNRYVRALLFDESYSMIKYYINKSNSKSVFDYFNSCNNVDELCIMIRKFFDWNNLNLDNLEYDEYVEFTSEFIIWCKKNSINYKFSLKPPSKKYLKLEQNKNDYVWQIPK